MGQLSRERAAATATAKKVRVRAKLGKAQPLKTFFSSYSDFDFNPEAPSGLEFQRLRKKQGWKRGDAAGDIAWQEFRSALVLEFNARFGTQANDLLAWQTLCVIVGIEEANKMSDWQACERLLKSQHFNFVDVIDAHRRGKNETVQTFATAEALEQHSKNTAAYFPKYHEAAGNLLRRVLKRLPEGAGTKEQPIKHNFQPSEMERTERPRQTQRPRQTLQPPRGDWKLQLSEKERAERPRRTMRPPRGAWKQLVKQDLTIYRDE